MGEKKVIVTQTRSGVRAHKSQRETLRCLGLGKIGRSVEHRLDASMMGMLRKVSHLIEVREVG